MKTRTNPKINKSAKDKAQKRGKDLNVPLNSLDIALEDVKKGKNLSPTFNNVEAAIEYLNN
jgi:hypothetical protein